MNPTISQLHLYDIVNTPRVVADLSHLETKAKAVGFVGVDQIKGMENLTQDEVAEKMNISHHSSGLQLQDSWTIWGEFCLILFWVWVEFQVEDFWVFVLF